jgi:protein-L-isoaspartate(D-aspartate) O-methyltransferase
MIYAHQRQRMIDRLKNLGITDTNVLTSMSKVPRHRFVSAGLEHQAYDEKALPIGFNQTISHPYTVAVMSQALNIKKDEKVLEIGTGSGYQAAVLCEMGAQVFTIEKIQQLGHNSDRLLRSLNYHYAMRIGDGTLGWQNYAPYNAIIVTAGAPIVPETLMSQLKPDGRLLIPVGEKDKQILTLFIKDDENYKKMELETLSFVPLEGKRGW